MKLGPTAIPVLSPENYTFFERLDFKLTPQILSLQINLLLNNTFQFRDLALREYKYLFKENIIESAQSLTKQKIKRYFIRMVFSWNCMAQLYDKKLKKVRK